MFREKCDFNTFQEINLINLMCGAPTIFKNGNSIYKSSGPGSVAFIVSAFTPFLTSPITFGNLLYQYFLLAKTTMAIKHSIFRHKTGKRKINNSLSSSEIGAFPNQLIRPAILFVSF